MRQQIIIVFSSGKNKRVAHEIARRLDCGVCKAMVCGAKEVDLFRNTLAQFLLPGKDGACHVTASDAEAGFNRIYINEMALVA